MFDFGSKFSAGLSYQHFLDHYANPGQRESWNAFHAQVHLTEAQNTLLKSFKREMKILVLAGAWCGDCINQCPIFDHFSRLSSRLQFRYFDRDDHDDLATELQVCGGKRVPSLVFLSEDNQFCGRYGDRTLPKYRQLVSQFDASFCPTGLVPEPQELVAAVVEAWLNEFERVQWMLRTSARLRKIHND